MDTINKKSGGNESSEFPLLNYPIHKTAWRGCVLESRNGRWQRYKVHRHVVFINKDNLLCLYPYLLITRIFWMYRTIFCRRTVVIQRVWELLACNQQWGRTETRSVERTVLFLAKEVKPVSLVRTITPNVRRPKAVVKQSAGNNLASYFADPAFDFRPGQWVILTEVVTVYLRVSMQMVWLLRKCAA
jgi:hypothetical protein